MAATPIVDPKVDKIVKQIESCYEKTPAPDDKPTLREHSSLRLEDILGPVDHGRWWRLYINPIDHQKAFQMEDPGLFYDKDKSPGYQQAMIVNYEKYLNKKPKWYTLKSKKPSKMTWDKYENFYTQATKGMGKKFQLNEPEKSENPEPGKKNPKQIQLHFPAASVLPDEVFEEMLEERPLVGKDTGDLETPLSGAWTVHVPPVVFKDPLLFTKANTDWPSVVAGILMRFEDELEVASKISRLAQLKAIAHCVRTLHMLHVFKDGNGRTNVFTLLPMLLMRSGFGISLGGKHWAEIDVGAIDEMFNGGYTIEQMAKFLWVYQDFGLLGKQNDTIIDIKNRGK